jgi:alkanesulfonate monooxygenase SsuD/methylene tetrahydromethanopterin reductase-like flavin-dependent oxidoreductase (luciferase family)
MRTLLDEGAIDFKGDFYSYTGVTTAARPVQGHLPLKVGTMGGPQSMQLAGEIADGLHTACAYSPEALRYAVEHFSAGVERAGRSLDGLDLGDSRSLTSAPASPPAASCTRSGRATRKPAARQPDAGRSEARASLRASRRSLLVQSGRVLGASGDARSRQGAVTPRLASRIGHCSYSSEPTVLCASGEAVATRRKTGRDGSHGISQRGASYAPC